MNLHAAQSIQARVELEQLMHVNQMLISAATNSNTMGIVSEFNSNTHRTCLT